jgi:hypothetical protein
MARACRALAYAQRPVTGAAAGRQGAGHHRGGNQQRDGDHDLEADRLVGACADDHLHHSE